MSKEFVQKCANYCKNTLKSHVLYSGEVLKLNDRRGKSKRVVVITNQFITYFKDKNVKENRLHYWINVTHLDFTNTTVIIKFNENKQFRFIPNLDSNSMDDVKRTLIELFLRIFASEELAPLDFTRYPHPNININANGVLTRFDIYCKDKNLGENQTLRKFLKNSLLVKQKYIEFDNQFQNDFNPDILYCVLRAIRPLSYIQLISLPKISDSANLFNVLADFVSRNSEVKILKLHNNADENFDRFSNDLSESQVSQLRGLIFEDVDMTSEELDRVQKLTVARKFSSASFINSIHDDIFDKFNQNYLSNEILAKLRYLSLDRTPGLKLNSLIRRILPLSVLSLANCDLEISEVIETLNENRIKNLRLLNLSGNKMSKSTTVELPPYLEHLDVSSVTWEAGTLPSFIQYVINYQFKNKVTLNFSNAQGVSDNDWQQISQIFEQSEGCNIESFSWSSNPPSPQLFEFLTKCKGFTTLFVNNCFDHATESSILESFSQSLPKMESLQNLSIEGSEGHELRERSIPLFQSLKQHPTLSLLNVDGNKIKEDGIKELKELILSTPSLQYLSFDNSVMTNINQFTDVISVAQTRKKPLHLGYPLNDIKTLQNTDAVTSDEINECKKKLVTLATGRQAISIQAHARDLDSLLSEPINPISSSTRNKSLRNKSQRGSNIFGRKRDSKVADNNRTVRTQSIRGKIPTFFDTKRSPTEEDPDSWINQPFEVYRIGLTDQFPVFLTEDLIKRFDENPIPDTEAETCEESGKKHSSKHSSKKRRKHKNSKEKKNSDVEQQSSETSQTNRDIALDDIEEVPPKESKEKRRSGRSKESNDGKSQMKVLEELFNDIPLLEPIKPPRNMFKHVDPYGRPLNEPLKFSDGTLLSKYDPEPIDLINVAAPKLDPAVSAKSMPEPNYIWPNQSEIDRSGMDMENGEFVLIDADQLEFEEIPGFDVDDDDDDYEEIEKVDTIVINRREREDNGEYQLPPKRFPVFPLLKTDKYGGNEEKPLPIDWNFQFTQVRKIGNYKYIKQVTEQSLEELVDQLNSDIKNS